MAQAPKDMLGAVFSAMSYHPPVAAETLRALNITPHTGQTYHAADWGFYPEVVFCDWQFRKREWKK